MFPPTPTIRSPWSHGHSHWNKVVIVNVPSDATFGIFQENAEKITGIPFKEQRLVFKGCDIVPSPSRLLSEYRLGNESTVSLVIGGRGGMASCGSSSDDPRPPTAIGAGGADAAFEDLAILRRCVHRIHRFNPGVWGRELLHTIDRCASLGHWSLIATGAVTDATLSPSVLEAACRAQRVDAIESLVSRYGMDVNQRDTGGWTLLHIAMVHRWEEVVLCLHKLGANDSATNDGVHASTLRPDLWRQVSGQEARAEGLEWEQPPHWQTVQEAVDKVVGWIVAQTMSAEVLCRRVCAAVDELGTAILHHDEKDSKKCLIGEFRLNWTVLAAAAGTGCSSLCHLCMEAGAAVNHAIGKGVTPLFIACGEGQLDCARLLLDRGAEVDFANTFRSTPLHAACAKGQLDCARLLLDRGAEVDFANTFRSTPLHTACAKGQLDCARLLLDRGAEVDFANTFGATPLHDACAKGQLECARLLLDWGAEVDFANNCGSTPLHDASEKGQPDCARLLLDWGAEVHKKDLTDATPLHDACAKGQLDCARLLLDRGAATDHRDLCGETPLHKACVINHRHIAALLLEHGADPTKENNFEGKTAAESARSDGTTDHELATVMEIAIDDPADAIKRLRGMPMTATRRP